MDVLIFILALMGIGFILYGGGAAADSIFKKEMSNEEFCNMLRKEKAKREDSKRHYEQLRREKKNQVTGFY